MSAFFILFSFGCSDHSEKEVRPAVSESSPPATSRISLMDNVVEAYANVTEALVNWDSDRVKQKVVDLQKQLDSAESKIIKDNSVQQNELKSLFINAKKNATGLANQNGITKQRQEFDQLSKTIYSILKSNPENSPKAYLQVCPMAFNDVDSGFWISKNNTIRNPYMGLHHPRYHSGMLGCGDNVDSINQTK